VTFADQFGGVEIAVRKIFQHLTEHKRNLRSGPGHLVEHDGLQGANALQMTVVERKQQGSLGRRHALATHQVDASKLEGRSHAPSIL
jgi:hypothetical protein